MVPYSHQAWKAEQTVRTIFIDGDPHALTAIRQAVRDHYGAHDVTDDAPVYAWHGLYVKGMGSMSYQVPDDAVRTYIKRPPFPANPVARMPTPPARAEEPGDAAAPEMIEPPLSPIREIPLPIIEETADSDEIENSPIVIAEPAPAEHEEAVTPLLLIDGMVVDGDDILLLTDAIPNELESDRSEEADAETADASESIDPWQPESSSITDDSRRSDLLAASAPAEGTAAGLMEVRNRTRLYHEVPDALFPSDGEVRWFTNGLHVLGHGPDPSVFQTPMDRVEELIVPRQAPQLPYIVSPRPTR